MTTFLLNLCKPLGNGFVFTIFTLVVVDAADEDGGSISVSKIKKSKIKKLTYLHLIEIS